MSKRRMTVKQFFARLKFAYVNARRSKKQFKENGIVFLPNGSVLVDPRKSLGQFGYTTIPTSEAYTSDYSYDEDEEEDWDEEEDEEESLY